MTGKEAPLVVMSVEPRQLLVAVHDIERIVDVQRDRARRVRMAPAPQINHAMAQTQQSAQVRCVLPTRYGRLRGPIAATVRQPAAGQFEGRIVTQIVKVIRVRIAAGNGEDACPQDVIHAMGDPATIAMIGDQRSQVVHQAEPPVGGRQQQYAAIGADRARVEGRSDLLATDRWQRERKLDIVIHDGCGNSCPTSELVPAPNLYVRSASYAAPVSESLPCNE